MRDTDPNTIVQETRRMLSVDNDGSMLFRKLATSLGCPCDSSKIDRIMFTVESTIIFKKEEAHADRQS